MPPRVAGISRMPGRIRPERVADFVGIRSMTDLRQLACPVVGGRAGLHTDEAEWQLREITDHLSPPKLPSDYRLACCIDAVHLEYVLGDIQTDRANLHVDDPLM